MVRRSPVKGLARIAAAVSRCPLKLFTFVSILLSCSHFVSGQELQTLYTVTNCSTGCDLSHLMQTADGTLYATATSGGISNRGSIVQLKADGSFSVLLLFSNSNTGILPGAALLQAADGQLYGSTMGGGASNKGTIFRIATNGSDFSILHSFNNTDGSQPRAQLVQNSDGDLFGTTYFGGTFGLGTVFKLTTNGQFTSLLSFNGTNGSYPSCALVLRPDGYFYGTTFYGGTNNLGTFFRITKDGVHTCLASFPNTNLSYNIANPEGDLTVAPDGTFYGAGYYDGSEGAVFKVTTNGVISKGFLCSYQEFIAAPMAFGIDGQLYAMTQGYLPNEIYKSFNPFISITNNNSLAGGGMSGLISGIDGALYGIRYGQFFRLPIAATPLLSIQTNRNLVVKGTAGGKYAVQYKTNLTDTEWLDVTNFTLSGSSNVITTTNGPDSRFFRAVRP